MTTETNNTRPGDEKARDDLREKLEVMSLSLRSGSRKGRHVTGVFDIPILMDFIQAYAEQKVAEALDSVENNLPLPEVADMNGAHRAGINYARQKTKCVIDKVRAKLTPNPTHVEGK